MRSSKLVSAFGPTTINERRFCIVLLILFVVSSWLHAAGQSNVKPGLAWSLDPPPSPWNLTPTHGAAEFAVTIPSDSKIVALHVTHSTIVDSDIGRGASLPAGQFHICRKKVSV